jgi:hypothetical protein
MYVWDPAHPRFVAKDNWYGIKYLLGSCRRIRTSEVPFSTNDRKTITPEFMGKSMIPLKKPFHFKS